MPSSSHKGTIELDGKSYELLDKNFPTIDKNNPYELSNGEKFVCERLKKAFLSSERLQRHIEFLYTLGGMYRVYNGNLLYHGCVPLGENGRCQYVTIGGERVKGKDLFDALELWARRARYSQNESEKEYGLDVMYFMWASPLSPMFGKEKMATFERYFLKEKELKKEEKNSYYVFYNDPEVVKRIFNEFGIDGGFSKAYQGVTGIAGYTLVSNSHEMKLVAHHPFVSIHDAIVNETNIHSESEIITKYKERLRVKNTDKGTDMKEKIEDLKALIICYKNGILREHQN